MGRFFNEQIECMPRSELEKLQLECLKKTIRRVYDYVKPYRDKMITAGIKPEDIADPDIRRRAMKIDAARKGTRTD